MARAGAQGIKEGNSHAMVSVGGDILPSNYRILDAGLGPDIDAITDHPHSGPPEHVAFGSKSINDRDGSRYHIVQAVETSLRRLNTDRVDLYIAHMPHHGMNLEEMLTALDDLVRQVPTRHRCNPPPPHPQAGLLADKNVAFHYAESGGTRQGARTRMNLRERFLEVMSFSAGVHSIKWEFGYWGETIKNWYASGLPCGNYPRLPTEITAPTSSLYVPAWTYRGPDVPPNGIAVLAGGLCWPTQGFPLDTDVRAFCGMDWPIKDRASWEKVKSERLRLDNIKDRFPANWADLVTDYNSRDYPLAIGGYPFGMFGTPSHTGTDGPRMHADGHG